MPLSESVIDYPGLRAEKARLGLRNEDLAERTGASNDTLVRVLSGRENVTLSSVKRVAAALGLRVKVTFEPIKTEPEKCV